MRNLIKTYATDIGVPLTDSQADTLTVYADFLLEYNKNVNLTAITEPSAVACSHFADSLSLISKFDLPQSASIADIGAGAGFPSVPVKVVRPDIKVTIIESLMKRVTFLNLLAEKLGVEIDALHMRAEQAGVTGGLRESFDIVTARAVAALPALCEFCLPLVKVGGSMVVLKGPSPSDEIASAKNAIRLLGGGDVTLTEFTLPDSSGRTIITIEKVSPTPEKYPRQRVNIPKNPL